MPEHGEHGWIAGYARTQRFEALEVGLAVAWKETEMLLKQDMMSEKIWIF